MEWLIPVLVVLQALRNWNFAVKSYLDQQFSQLLKPRAAKEDSNQARTYIGVWGCHTPSGKISVCTGPNLAFLSANNQAYHLHR